MKAFLVAAAAGALLLLDACAPKAPQSLAGQWQGTMRMEGKDYRTVLKIEDAAGAPRVTYYSPDEDVSGMPAGDVTFDGKALSLALPRFGGGFKAALSADGNTLSGTFVQDTSHPLDLRRATEETAWVIDRAKHQAQQVTVEPGVTLEVLDFGGTGRPLVFLAGLGRTAHDFDTLAQKFTATHHVYAVTRRGYGVSSTPALLPANYTATRMGRDVLAVAAALKLERPVLAGHSIAGSEMSAAANLAPDKVGGLIYLDAGYSYAFYIPAGRLPNNIELSARTMLAALHKMGPLLPAAPADELAAFRVHLRDLQADIAAADTWLTIAESVAKPRPPESSAARTVNQGVAELIVNGTEKVTTLKGVPTLAIFATEAKIPPNAPPALARLMEVQRAEAARQIEVFTKGVPGARIVGLPGAGHFVWRSHETEVTREMRGFLRQLR